MRTYIGNVSKEPEIKHYDETGIDVMTFCFAYKDSFENKYCTIKMYGPKGKAYAAHLKLGRRLLVTGKIEHHIKSVNEAYEIHDIMNDPEIRFPAKNV